jgi:hypothetical protein
MSSCYNLSQPTSIENPVTGWVANTQATFLLNAVGQSIRPKSIRLNGCLELAKLDNATKEATALTAADKVSLGNSGVHGFIRAINVRFNGVIVESISSDYGRFVALKNEATKYQLDQTTLTTDILSLCGYSNDADDSGESVKNLQYLGSSNQITNDTTATWSQLPFSILLDACFNSSNVALPNSRTGEIQIDIFFQDVTKSGLVSRLAGANTFDYQIKNLEMRYLTDPEVKVDGKGGAIVLEQKTCAHIGTIQNLSNNIEFSVSSAVDTVVCAFLNTTHTNSSNSLIFDYTASEALVEKLNYLEVKINGADNILQHPLQYQASEIIYNYLLAWRPYIQTNDPILVERHSLTYTKLANVNGNNVQTGFGVGCNLFGGVPSGSRVGFNMQLQSVPAEAYSAYFFTIGKLIL